MQSVTQSAPWVLPTKAPAPCLVSNSEVAAAMNGFYAGSAKDKFERAERMLRASQYSAPPREHFWSRSFRFTKKLDYIGTVPFLTCASATKPAHRVASAAVVTYRVQGDPPLVFKKAKYGAARIGSGTQGRDPAVAIAIFHSGDRVDARVFGLRGKSFNGDFGQQTLGVSAADVEGPLVFTPGPALASICVKGRKDPRPVLANIPVGTELGVIRAADNNPRWSVAMTLESPLVASWVADRNWHFRHSLHAETRGGHFMLGLLKTVSRILNAF